MLVQSHVLLVVPNFSSVPHEFIEKFYHELKRFLQTHCCWEPKANGSRPWIPEDDLVLKNAVEAGASLESLAKGAVRFSRKYTGQELRERWHSLLYDPIVSNEASCCMTEFEQYAPTFPSKSITFGTSKDNNIMPAKRKSDSICKLYYATRKRICNEPFDPMDLSFVMAPSNSNFFGDGNGPLSGNCMLEDPVTNPFGLEESTLDIIHHDFPEILTDDGTVIKNAAALIFHSELPHPVQANFHIETHNVHRDLAHVIGANIPLPGSSGLEELGQPNDLLLHSLFEADDPGSKFGDKQVCGSPIKVCVSSFPNSETLVPEMPNWKVDGISDPCFPVDVYHIEKDLQTGDIFALPDDGDVVDINKSGVFGNQKPCHELKGATNSTEGYLAVVSNSLMDFTNDDELLMEDGKDMIGKFFKDSLSSILSNSPADVNQDHMPSISEPKSSVGLDTCLMNPPSTCLEKLCDNSESRYGDGYEVEAEGLSPMLALNPQFPEPCDDVICCTLNTENLEVPCNDDVIFHKQLPSSAVSHAAQQSPQPIGNPGNKETGERASNLMHREHKPTEHASSQVIGSHVLPKVFSNQPVGDCGVKFELPENDPSHMASKRAVIGGGSSSHISSGNVSKDGFMSAATTEEIAERKPVNSHGHNLNDFLTEKQSHGSDSFKSFPLEQEPSMIQNYQGVSVEDFHPLEIAANTSTSNQEELAVESDSDLPYFSDVEAMILEMDLDPDDLPLYSSEQVSKYQQEKSRRTIIRLEQSFHACMGRDIAFHGAFAVLIGRQTKHYIRKPEVLLGRATEDVIVDIDLGREARANKISRRQAILKMDKRGSFFLKNLGKFPISVNDKEVAYGQSLNLYSSCLIEIRGMPFMFETNQANVKRFVDSSRKLNNHGDKKKAKVEQS